MQGSKAGLVVLMLTLLATPFAMGFSGCPLVDGAGPFIANSSSGCTRDDQYNPVVGYFGCEDDQFVMTPNGNTIQLLHTQAVYNCCADEIAVDLVALGNVLRVSEREVLTSPCRCVCCYNVDSTIDGLEPGTYTVQYCWNDYTVGERCHTEQVVVGGS